MIRRASPPMMVAARSAPVKAKGAAVEVGVVLAAVAMAGVTVEVGMVTNVVATFVPPDVFVPDATKVLIAEKLVATAGPPFMEMWGSVTVNVSVSDPVGVVKVS
jgi:hypothetical protein